MAKSGKKAKQEAAAKPAEDTKSAKPAEDTKSAKPVEKSAPKTKTEAKTVAVAAPAFRRNKNGALRRIN